MENYSKHILRVQKKGTFGDIVSQVDVSFLNKKGIQKQYETLKFKYPEATHNIIEVKSNISMRLF